MKNLSAVDRIVRLVVSLVFIEIGYFWLGGGMQFLAVAIGVILLVTALAGFCPLNKLIGIRTLRENSWSMKGWSWATLILVVLVVLVGGSYTSNFVTKRVYLEEFNQMNHYYKQTLFLTGQQKREEAIANYDELVKQYAAYEYKYTTYHPYALKGDPQFNSDLARVSLMIAQVGKQVYEGDLEQAHLALEQVRPVFQDIFKRNGFSMLAVALVDFHDVMETVLDAANEKDVAHVAVTYADADIKLKAIEVEANDAEIQAIRKNLENVRQLAEDGKLEDLPGAANVLKSSFVKVYLKRG